MEISEKLTILSDAAKYDVSCSSSGSERSVPAGGFGNAKSTGICHTFSADGRCVSLLKILLSNVCIYDCAYCMNRSSNDIRRATFTPEEIADLTINFYRRNYIEGLFLSSGIIDSPDRTMEKMIRVLVLLRHTHRFGGYIHVKMIPGSSAELINQAAALADRVSSNIELPSEKSLTLLAPDKHKSDVFGPLRQIQNHNQNALLLPSKERKAAGLSPVGMSTQMIIGATPENDRQILTLSQNLYKKALLKRVYYSAYIPTNETKNLPSLDTKPPLLREHRLYQADWLLRYYGFHAGEILTEAFPNLDENFDPKTFWALKHLELFPVDINRVNKEMLIRIPGIGIRSAHKILRARRYRNLDEAALKALGVSLKRARYFIVAGGKYLGGTALYEESISRALLHQKNGTRKPLQPSLFLTDAITGEL